MNRIRSRGGKWPALVAGAVLIAALLTGCGSAAVGPGGSNEVDRSASLRIAYPVTQSLDPAQAAEPAQLLIATWPVYDRLIQITNKATYAPMLATGWEFSPDGKALTLTLRHGVTFSDGVPFDAAAVKANIEYSKAASGSALQANVAGITAVEVVSPDTVRLDLEEPSTTVLSTLSSTLGGLMISPKALAGNDLAGHPVGTGAYVVDSFQPGQRVTYKRRTDNGGIWDDATGKPATVSIDTFGNADAMSNALTAGQADLIVWSSTTERFQTQIDTGRLQHTVMGGVLNMTGINFNRTRKPFNDPKVRAAVNYAIDRKSLVDAFMPDTATRVQPWPDGLPGFDQAREDSYRFDPAKAEQLLAEAGYADGIDGGEIAVANVGSLRDVAQAVQANLAAVGIKVELRNVDVYTLVTQWSQGQSDAELMYMSMPSIDPYSWLQRLFVNPAWTPGGNAEIAEMATGLDNSTMSEQDRAAAIGKIIDHATTNALYAPLWQGVGGFMSSPKVKGLDDLASVNGGVADLRGVYLTK
ncbi:ABC transporter substrate-binding protein [Nocardia vermiculata]|uniref:Solute-binding protein family 5 domain-containing protein n=1 Tax=Nocardia vermiculata TaxID=257274 RepID=A0A846XW02_9NOCA|nr:ABC transporter substrate-binding protein [Nocardia vermiculata]NKY51306.1 hypothetical protein [Nocardia vermiculata]